MSEKKNIKLISKNEAKAKGLKKYYTGIPCKEGHLSERYVSSSNCIACHVIKRKSNRAKTYNRIRKRELEYKQNHSEQIKLYQDKYRKRYKIKLREYSKKYRIHHKNSARLAQKRWREDNVILLKAKKAEYYQNNKEVIGIHAKSQRAQINKTRKKHWDNDANFRIISTIRSRILIALRGASKSASTMELIGCSIEFLKTYLQSTAIKNGYMDFNIENYSGHQYHIDHIIPCVMFDHTKIEEQKRCHNWRNLQILDAIVNHKKYTKVCYAAV